MPLLSIPSPSTAWQYFDLTAWLRDVFGWSLPLDFRIHAYAICILLGIVAAVLLANRRLNARGVERWIIIDIAIWAVPAGIIGGRLFHVFTHVSDYFGPGIDPLSFLYIWEGGLAIFGALILGSVGAWIGCRQVGLRFTSFIDAVVPGVLLAQAFGRLGNYFNHELFGMPTSLPWGLQIESTNAAFPKGLPEGTLFHPTFLYEIIWNVLGVVVILLLDRKFTLQWGKVLALYLIWYGVGRSFLESIRVDTSETFAGIRTNVWMSFAAILLGIVIFIVQSRRHTGKEPSPYLPGREPRPKSDVDSDDTFSEHEDDDERLVAQGSGAVTTPTDRA
ncbi:prolipoprotein diacylglyceryl transferase [Curtobacterium sp. PhB142]|uniref:prolipoprotein diacylglyceryl transferase n=1 Tax=unclassified Curtobacterium TaxID=257496 RepID=UPI001052B59C|nr:MULTISPECIES: prolipoprotein diacylglyceryl transferase [unclassified Curtobacterium]TCL84287.1 prolipoprotein diacylglyceryl transferase [Curtobacterium sp. PhB142]TCM01550.1 prolipoprotein diacylglyceryl transferase [Curtobacterium sp. PhB134]TDW74632.1 prolipoprotein diacylglyceryl transferase [Curtobacterium sp. PhB25]